MTNISLDEKYKSILSNVKNAKFWKNIYIFRNSTNPPTNYPRIKLGVHTIERVYIETP